MGSSHSKTGLEPPFYQKKMSCACLYLPPLHLVYLFPVLSIHNPQKTDEKRGKSENLWHFRILVVPRPPFVNSVERQ